jgi:subtilisin family serine protease
VRQSLPSKRSRLPLLLAVGLFSTLIGAGSVLAAMPRPAVASALLDYDNDTPALKAADLDRALAAGGASSDRVVVTYTDGAVDQATLAHVHAVLGGTPLTGDAVLGREVLRLQSGDAADALERARGVPGVAEVRFERTVSVEAALPTSTDDPFASYAWGVSKVGANQVWSTSTGTGVKVAVLDCGIHANHPDLAGQVILEKNFTASATADDRCNHGTHVAGAIAALTNNGLGVASVAPGVRLLNGKVLDDTGHGFAADIESGLRWAADNGARVINLSLGTDLPCPVSMQAAVAYVRSKGVVIVAASGNGSLNHAATPANCSGVLAVGAVDQNDARPSWSNAGAGVALAAPGVKIGSPVNPDINAGALYGVGSGTSIASPHVAGVAALLWASSYGTSAEAVISRLESTADHVAGTGTLWTYGRVSAVNAIGAPAPALTATPREVAAPTSTPQTVPPRATAGATEAPVVLEAAMPAKASAAAPATPTAKPTLAPTRVPPTTTATRVPPTPSPTPVKLLAPTNVTAVTVAGGQVQVAWQAPLEGHTTFNVYRGNTSGLDMRLIAARVASSAITFSEPAGPAGQVSTYSVAAQSAAGEGPHSPPVRNTSIR